MCKKWSIVRVCVSEMKQKYKQNFIFWGTPGWLSGWASALGSGCDPRVPGSSPTSSSLHGACFSLRLCLYLSLSLCVSHEYINKILKRIIIHVFLNFRHTELFFFFKILFIYSWQTHRVGEREAETQAEGEAGSMQGAWCGTPTRESGITRWAKGRCSTT